MCNGLTLYNSSHLGYVQQNFDLLISLLSFSIKHMDISTEILKRKISMIKIDGLQWAGYLSQLISI